MDKSLVPQVNQEEIERITEQLLAERLCAAAQALIDNAGIDEVKKAVHPYIFHGGHAGACFFSNIVKGDSIDRISKSYFLAESSLSNGQSVLEIREKGAICETFGCILGNGPPELCIHFLQSCVDGIAHCIDDNYEIVSQSFLNMGASCCQKIIRRKGTRLSTREELGPLKKRIDKPDLSNEDMFSNVCQYLGNWWDNITSGSIDLFGAKESIEILRPYMRHCGMATGISLSKQLKIKETDASAIGTIVDFYGGVMQQTGNASISNNTVEKEITSCPFSSSSVETCKQMEFINQGLVEVINPDYEFVYDRMMSKGDKTCHWTIKKKGEAAKVEPAKEKPKEEVHTDDPIKRLTNKFIDGEITEEELDRKMAHLKKHGLVK